MPIEMISNIKPALYTVHFTVYSVHCTSLYYANEYIHPDLNV